jgi:DNA-directed RNA polymerase subunit RPC12/RpoP
MLMKKGSIKIDQQIVDEYINLDRSKKWLMKKTESTKTTHKFFVYQQIRKEILQINNNIDYIVDMLVQYLYRDKNSKFKETLWWSFGDILLEHIINNLNISEVCCDCGSRFIQIKQRQIRCNSCQKNRDRINAKLRKRKQRNKL